MRRTPSSLILIEVSHPHSSCPAPGRLPTLPRQPHCFTRGCSPTPSVHPTECPQPPNVPLIVGSTIFGVFLIGVLVLLIWRFLMELLDRREYRRFEKEKSKAKWNDVREPICATGLCWGAQIHWGGDRRRGHPFQRQPCRPEPSLLLIFQPSWILPFRGLNILWALLQMLSVLLALGWVGWVMLCWKSSTAQHKACHFSPCRLTIPSSRVPPPLSSTPGLMNEALDALLYKEMPS